MRVTRFTGCISVLWSPTCGQNSMRFGFLPLRQCLRVTLIHVPHPKCGVGVHGLFDRQNVADRVAKLAGDLPSGTVTAVCILMRRRRFRRRHLSLQPRNRLALNRALTAGFDRTCRVKELVVIVESEFWSDFTHAPVSFSS